MRQGCPLTESGALRLQTAGGRPFGSSLRLLELSLMGLVVLVSLRAQDRAEPGHEAETTAAMPATVPTLVQQFQNPSAMHRDRKAALNALASLGPAAAETVPALEAELSNPRSELSYAAYRALGAIRNEPLLDHKTLFTQGAKLFLGREGFCAFKSLSQPGVPRDRALLLLHEVLSTNLPSPIQLMALDTLGQMKPSDPSSICALVKSIGSSDDFIATTAAAALTHAPMTNPPAMDVLVGAVVSGKDRVAVESAKALARFGPQAAPLLRAIIEALKRSTGDTDFRRVGAYLHVLRAMGLDACAAGPALAEMLEESAPIYQGSHPFGAKSVRRYLLLTLADIGVPSSALPAIIDELSNTLEPPTLAAAARAAGHVGPGKEKVVPFLRQALERKGLSTAVSLETIESKKGPVPEPVTSPYLEIIHALARLGPTARGAVPVLRDRAKDPVRRERYTPPYQQLAARVADELARMPGVK